MSSNPFFLQPHSPLSVKWLSKRKWNDPVTCPLFNVQPSGVFQPVVYSGRAVPLEVQESLEGSVAGEKTAP